MDGCVSVRIRLGDNGFVVEELAVNSVEFQAGDGAHKTLIPNKLFFRIGEVSEMLGVEPHVIRYWESEFPGLAPKKSDSGQRMFRRKDVELLLRIKDLLYEQKFTLEGARKAMLDKGKGGAKADVVSKITARQRAEETSTNPFGEIRRELAAILKMMT